MHEEKILVLDFDHTCYDTDSFLLFEIRLPMLARFNIPVKKWEEAYESSAKIGYSLEVHLQELNKIMNSSPCSLEDIQAFGKSIKFSEYLYSDVFSFLKEAKEKGYKILLLSFGYPDWQEKKVLGVGLSKLVDKVIYVNKHGDKAEMIKKYAGASSKLIFVDNNGHELDKAQRELPQVETYFMKRTPEHAMNAKDDEEIRVRYLESRKMAETKSVYQHKICHSLSDVIL